MYEISGIYLIINKVNGKMYVGSAMNCKRRWSEHKTALNKNKHCKHGKCYLQHAWILYGAENFKFVIFENEIPTEDLLLWEQAVLDFYESYNPDKGYNNVKFAGSNRGWKPSQETLIRMSKAQKGKLFSLETRTRMSESQKNKPLITEETRVKLSETHKGEKHWNYGKTVPDDVCEKISNSVKGEKHNNYGKIASPEKLINMSKGRTGKYTGEQNPRSKLKIPQVIEIKTLLIEDKLTQREIAKIFAVGTTTIYNIARGKNWKHIVI